MDNAVSHTQKNRGVLPTKPNDSASSQSLRIADNEPALSNAVKDKEARILLEYELRYEMERFCKNA